MSDTVRYILAASIGVAILFMIGSQLWTRSKINTIKSKYKTEEDSLRVKFEFVGTRLPSSMDNETIDYIIQSLKRNNFTTTKLVGDIGKYEVDNFVKHAGQDIVTKDAEFIVARLKQNVVEKIADIYKELKPGGIIAITDSPKKDVLTKDIMNTAKYSGWRYEYEKIGEGMILIAK